jgi:uncharacterized protein (TIGR03643 family)
MSLSKKLKTQFLELSDEDKKKLIKMAIEDKTSYQEIKKKFGFSPNEIEKIMCFALDKKRFMRWKMRASKRTTLKGRPKDYFKEFNE